MKPTRPHGADSARSRRYAGGEGLFTVDVANNVLLQDSPAAFVFRFGASQRYVARARLLGTGFDAESSLPGGQSAVMKSPFYVNQLAEWLTNKRTRSASSRPSSSGR